MADKRMRTKEGNTSKHSCAGHDADLLAGHGRLVYVPDTQHGFSLGKLVDIGADTLTVQLVGRDHDEIVKAAYGDVVPAEEDQSKDMDDNCGLMYLNEGTLLNNCKLRYAKKQIYTYVANILISINPYEIVPNLYGEEMIRRYEGKSLGAMPPHIFAIADKAYRDMRRLKQSQSIIVSGESGAGKTESQKCILRYLCQCWGSSAGPVEQRILETNPILEAFGNAKTLRNNNSSRFGKFVEIHFDNKYQVAGGFVSHYLLEKTRACYQQAGERNFHVFYQLFAGDDALAKQLQLSNPDDFQYLRNGCTQFFASPKSLKQISNERKSKQCQSLGTLSDGLVDDHSDFLRLSKALKDVGIGGKMCYDLFRTLAGILHMGNVEFDENSDDSRGGSKMLSKSTDSLTVAADLLGLEQSQLRLGLTSRMMQPTKSGVKGTLIMVPLKSKEATAARDALAKAIYNRLFDFVVASINKSIPFGEDSDVKSFIGVLDIAGFEFFGVNSFEQFCINYCNEKLQHFFNDRILRQEQDLYAKEGLNVPTIAFSDNQDCIDLFEAKTSGLLDCLDEEARLPRSSAQHFTSTILQFHQKSSRIGPPRKSAQRNYREMRDEDGFLVNHYAGEVCYETAMFLEKNNDALHVSLELLIEESTNSFIKQAFALPSSSKPVANGKVGSSQNTAGKLNIASVSNKFRSQLLQLIQKLGSTGTHFVRCIKPNSEMAPGKFNGSQILGQLNCAGMASVLKLMQKGFPSRTMFADLYAMYQKALPPQLARLDARMFCKCLFYALGLNDADYKFGMTKVFFRPGKFAEFDRLMKQDPADMKQLIEKVQAWIHRIRWKKAQYGAWSCIKLKNKIAYRAEKLVKIQSALRGHIARKVHRPRILAMQRAKVLQASGVKFREIADKLANSGWQKKVDDLGCEVELLIQQIKAGAVSGQGALEECARLQSVFDAQLKELKTQVKLEEEKARIQRMQEEAIRQQQKEKEEQRHRDEQQQLANERRNLELQRQQAVQMEDQLKRAQLKMATNSKSNGSGGSRASANSSEGQSDSFSSKYDLLNWTYAKLRDAINTSTNIEFLEACRAEFHRRLRMYQEWKTANEKANNGGPKVDINGWRTGDQLRPKQPMSASGKHQIQRYFRVPFEKPVGIDDYSSYSASANNRMMLPISSSGFWYAHFDGQYIARQMELHTRKPPLLLVAGKHDEKMCELTLDETRLTHKKGAEVLAVDFETLWSRHGGLPYCQKVV